MANCPQKIPFPLCLKLWDIKHLEYALGGYTLESLQYFITNKSTNVKAFTLIQNRNGKTKQRVVYNTSDGYKKLLKTINKKILQKAIFPEGILGGVLGKAIADMAKYHCGRESLFSMDFKNFFPSIKSGMVFRFFQRSNCSNKIAAILTDLITLENALPQGFPTSPMMANLVAYDLDVTHSEIARKNKLLRTRWIDDIVVSGRTANVKKAIPSLIGSVKQFGFTINNKKSRFNARSEKPVVVGLEVSRNSPHATDMFINEIDRLLRKCNDEGLSIVQSTYDPKGDGQIRNLQASLIGRIKFLAKYDPEIAKSFFNRMDSLNWSDSENEIVQTRKQFKTIPK